MSVLRSTPNHTPLKCRCLYYCYIGIRHVYLLLQTAGCFTSVLHTQRWTGERAQSNTNLCRSVLHQLTDTDNHGSFSWWIRFLGILWVIIMVGKAHLLSLRREDSRKLWQKYKVDLALYGHLNNYEQSCPMYKVEFKHELNYYLTCYWIWGILVLAPWCFLSA